MKVLVLGAGAVGGYFGGRLIESGVDVTFLVRKKRQQQINGKGLFINSIHGDIQLEPKTLVSGEEVRTFDVIIFATKAQHLEGAIQAVEPYVGPSTTIIPLLNGISHIYRLQEVFGKDKIIGGFCFIETTLNDIGHVVQTSKSHQISFGELDGERSSRIESIQTLFSETSASFKLSDNILQDMWHKYLFITTLSGITTLMRSSVGPILEVKDGEKLTLQLFEEVASIMEAADAPIADDIVDKQMATMKMQHYNMKASMLRDIEKGISIEVDHLQGYLLTLADRFNLEVPLLRVIYQHLKVYEINLNKK
ncbi:ketopantoate reductase family protein [Alkalihalobacterium alkalinitrilicum]|uniref:ketopantoate reductase family protein n=1 Tax=Alkalihalobacterium alkalinitrilicum TaxID=427920 RepID=UPI000994D26C|nr:ketopantoate reductase family protein [Alkalihalobacterium alkalinitrilicum]